MYDADRKCKDTKRGPSHDLGFKVEVKGRDLDLKVATFDLGSRSRSLAAILGCPIIVLYSDRLLHEADRKHPFIYVQTIVD